MWCLGRKCAVILVELMRNKLILLLHVNISPSKDHPTAAAAMKEEKLHDQARFSPVDLTPSQVRVDLFEYEKVETKLIFSQNPNSKFMIGDNKVTKLCQGLVKSRSQGVLHF
jgi:hypothetical protein